MAKRKNLRQLNIKISNLDGRKVAAGDQHIFSKAMLNGAIKQHGDTITRKQTIVDALEQDVKLGLTEIGQALKEVTGW